MTEPVACEVLVVGSGPSGSLVASELHRHGVEVVVLEQRVDASPGSRAIGVHPPVLAALEAGGATERILAEAARIPRGIAIASGRTVGEVRFDRLPLRFPFVASVPQAVTEAAVAAGGPPPLRGMRVIGAEPTPDGVRVHAQSSDGAPREWLARTVVVATGSSGRRLLSGLFTGRSRSYPDRYLMTDLPDAPEQPSDTAVITLGAHGVAESFPLPGGGRRLVAREAVHAAKTHPRRSGSDAEHLAEAIATRMEAPELATRVREANRFSIRRVLLDRMVFADSVIAIGDAAHEVSPIGGQGMNLGLLDAATLARVLADVRSGSGRDARGASRADRLRMRRTALARWERSRLASARTAARLAGLNTSLGRPWPRRLSATSAVVLGAALRTPLARLPERAYAMGFDREG
ncbi:NAD(P)/FAD-dependent oxidoreductase [Leucobacter sp. USCH14]|uniref:FAD-dependent oxidoreductase n=1 Tax=Leucobacter sp. USCH14 TaxID=3024838 RepID=UPI0030B0E0D2